MKIFGMSFAGILFSLALGAALAAQQTPAKNPSGEKMGPARAEEVRRGKAVFDVQCAVCHYAASTAKKIGPGLKGWTRRGVPGPDGEPLNDASVRARIENGGKNMPGFKATLSSQQITDLVSYLKTL